MRICNLREKEVVNCVDCRRMGYVDDIEFEISTGCVEAIIVPGPGKMCGLIGSEYEYIIPFKCIKQIGPDIILVQVCEDDVKHKCKIP